MEYTMTPKKWLILSAFLSASAFIIYASNYIRSSQTPDNVIAQNGEKLLTLQEIHEREKVFPNRIKAHAQIEREGRDYAKRGLYEEALKKYNEALDPKYYFYEHEKGPTLGSIRDIHQRQGKLELALQENKFFTDAYRKSGYWDNPDYVNFSLDKQLEIEAMIRSRDLSSPKPIYDHIQYIRDKYKRFLPPNGFISTSSGWISDIIHLYNHIGDPDGGIKFMNECIEYLKSGPNASAYRFQVEEYQRIKEAFDEDKRTSQKGHLQKVIETSKFIGW